MERGGRTPWELRRGPFTEEDFLELPETHWTLLVSDVEKQAPDMAALIEPFRFVPDWRIDDLMISYAPEHGTVGPHVDDYDVFLLQALGQRRWQISTQPVDPDNFLPDTELRIMDEFEPVQDWVLEPGDLLYLPPKVAHHGVALGPCMTCSIGFRAPLHSDMVGRYVDFLMEDVTGFTDADIGAAARVVHDGCKRALDAHFTVKPVRDEDEGASITVPAGYDAHALRLTGNVVGDGPHRGTLAHRGWRATDVRLPKLVAGHDGRVLAPAEVELA